MLSKKNMFKKNTLSPMKKRKTSHVGKITPKSTSPGNKISRYFKPQLSLSRKTSARKSLDMTQETKLVKISNPDCSTQPTVIEDDDSDISEAVVMMTSQDPCCSSRPNLWQDVYPKATTEDVDSDCSTQPVVLDNSNDSEYVIEAVVKKKSPNTVSKVGTARCSFKRALPDDEEETCGGLKKPRFSLEDNLNFICEHLDAFHDIYVRSQEVEESMRKQFVKRNVLNVYKSTVPERIKSPNKNQWNVTPRISPTKGKVTPQNSPTKANVTPPISPTKGKVTPQNSPTKANVTPQISPTKNQSKIENKRVTPQQTKAQVNVDISKKEGSPKDKHPHEHILPDVTIISIKASPKKQVNKVPEKDLNMLMSQSNLSAVERVPKKPDNLRSPECITLSDSINDSSSCNPSSLVSIVMEDSQGNILTGSNVNFKIPDAPNFDDALIYSMEKAKIFSGFIFSTQNSEICSKYKKLRQNEKMLYQNILCRKWAWLRVDGIYYEYISDIPGALESLTCNGFIQTIDLNCQLEELLHSMNLDELADMCVHFNLPKKGTKKTLIDKLLRVTQRQGYQFTASNLGDKMLLKAVEMLKGKLIKLAEAPRDLFSKLVVASTCPSYLGEEKDRISGLRLTLRGLSRKESILLPLNVVPRNLFVNSRCFEEYFKSVKLKEELTDAKDKKMFSHAADLCEKIKEEFKSFMSQEADLLMLQNFCDDRKFTAGSNLAYCLSSTIDVLKREKRYDLALECLDILLKQHHFVKRRRGTWYEEKALILERYKKASADVVYEVFITAFYDPSLTLLGRRILSKKAEPYVNKNKKLSEEKKDHLRLLLSLPGNLKIEEYYCKSMPNVVTSRKQQFVKEKGDGTKFYGTVEAIASDKYNGIYDKRFHDEGELVRKLALAVFYPVFFESNDVPGMFVSELQDRPLDWGSDRFFERRRSKFEAHKKKIMESGLDGVGKDLQLVLKTVKNTRQTLIHISDQDVVNMMGLLKSMTLEKFVNFAFYLFEYYNERKSGLPDLTMFNDDSCVFVEVKGPSDTPSITQVLWIEKLREFGLEAYILKVTNRVASIPERSAIGEQTQSL